MTELSSENASALPEGLARAIEADDAAIDLLVDRMEELNALEGGHRLRALVEWARSPFYSTCLMVCEGWQGALAREAFALLRRAAEADTPGRAWWMADSRRGRRSIYSALKIDAGHHGSFYACFPFRIIDHDDATWIAGAVGCPRVLSSKWIRSWEPFDITDVILWNPRTNELRIMGEAARQSLTFVPERLARLEDQITLYGDGFSFFRAWADRRALFLEQFRLATERTTHVLPVEPSDGNVPGALQIGKLTRVSHELMTCLRIKVGPGLDPAAVKKAIFRAAHLPRVEAA
jgi:hypothetical protein